MNKFSILDQTIYHAIIIASMTLILSACGLGTQIDEPVSARTRDSNLITPDLTVLTFEAELYDSKNEVRNGESIRIRFGVSNIGQRDAIDVTIGLYASEDTTLDPRFDQKIADLGEILYERAKQQINVGDILRENNFFDVRIPDSITAGSKVLFLMVDDDDFNIETNEDNNIKISETKITVLDGSRPKISNRTTPSKYPNFPTSSSRPIIGIKFNEPVTGVTAHTFYLEHNGTKVLGKVEELPIDPEAEEKDNYWFITIEEELIGGESYDIVVTAGIKDLADNAFIGETWPIITASRTTSIDVLNYARTGGELITVPGNAGSGDTFIIGGSDEYLQDLDKATKGRGDIVERFDASNDSFLIQPERMKVPRDLYPSVTLLDDNRTVLVAGGYYWDADFDNGADTTNGKMVVTGAIETFDFRQSGAVWNESPAVLATPRWQHTATMLTDGRVLIVGGLDANGNAIQATEIISADGSTIAAGPTLSKPRVNHTATRLSDGKVLILGGTDGHPQHPTVFRFAEIIDPKALNTTTIGEFVMIQPRMHHTATLLPDNTVFVTGGYVDYAKTKILASAEIYNPDTSTPAKGFFSDFAFDMQDPRADHVANLVSVEIVEENSDEQNSIDLLVLIGGAKEVSGPSSISIPSQSIEVYDIQKKIFRSLDTGLASYNRIGASTGVLTDGRILIVGGKNDRLINNEHAGFTASGIPAIYTPTP